MAIRDLLPSTLGENGSAANIALAVQLVKINNREAISELIALLNDKNKHIQSDAIKVLYEVAYIKPELIADYYQIFFQLLSNKNNRLVWGAMIALASITELKHAEIFESLEIILNSMRTGSVITIDNAIDILAKLNSYASYTNEVEPYLIEQLWKCPIKQLPMYVEKSLLSICQTNKALFLDVIHNRIAECETESQRKRLDKAVLKIHRP
jgi:HEAT repeat protein